MLQTWQWSQRLPTWSTWGARRSLGTPIAMASLRYGFLPAHFRHRGADYRVTRIVQINERLARHNQPSERYFRVICRRGEVAVLVQELQAGSWRVIWERSNSNGSEPYAFSDVVRR